MMKESLIYEAAPGEQGPEPGLPEPAAGSASEECLIGASAHVAELREFIRRQAAHQQTVLLIGERGLRQEQLARALHQECARRASPFLAVNARGLSTEALHQLLFGPRGLIENCRGGTIYLNELVNLPQVLQQRFAAYLEDQRWRAQTGDPVCHRLVFATEWRPEELRAENRIAYGLVEMLRPHSFTLKPLRERREDIPHLASYLADRAARRLGKGPHLISPAAMKLLLKYSWEGNIDELEAVLESVVTFMPRARLDEGALPARMRQATRQSIPPGGIDLARAVESFERSFIDRALEQTGGNQTRASRLLGLRVQTLNMKLKRFAQKVNKA